MWIESETRKTGVLSCKEFAELRPFMLMIDPEGVGAIKQNWAAQCRAGDVSCEQPLESFAESWEMLNDLSEIVLRGPR